MLRGASQEVLCQSAGIDSVNFFHYRIFTMNDKTSCHPHTDCCPPPAPAQAPEQDSELAQLAKALGHPARVAILRLLLARNECICGELCGEIPLAQSTISQHLKMMKEAGLIQGEVDGPRVCYCVNPGKLARLKALIAAL